MNLAVKLSKLERLSNVKASLEQYQTESEMAASILWDASLAGDVKGKVIADLGCGNGILGVGALLLCAKKVYFVEKDEEVIKVAKKNAKGLKAEFFLGDVKDFNKKVDVVFQNPPFGVQKRKADKDFLIKAFEISKKVYSFHKIESKGFIDKISKEFGFKVIGIKEMKFSLRRTMKHHKKDKYDVNIGVWVLERQ